MQKIFDVFTVLSTKLFLVAKKIVLFSMKIHLKTSILLVYFFIQNFLGFLCYNFLVLYYLFSADGHFGSSHYIAAFTCYFIQGAALFLYIFSKVPVVMRWLEKIVNNDAFILKYFSNNKRGKSLLKAFIPVFFFL